MLEVNDENEALIQAMTEEAACDQTEYWKNGKLYVKQADGSFIDNRLENRVIEED